MELIYEKKKINDFRIFLSFIYSSCSDELEQIPQLSGETKFENFGIADARTYFEENATDLAPLRFTEELPTKSVDLPAFELIPEWNKALESGHTGVRLIEVPIHSNTINLYVESVIKSGKMIYQKRALTQRRLVIDKRNTGEMEMFVITLVSSPTANGNTEKSLKNFRYLGGGDFTGRVFCSTLDGKFVKAFGYSNGQLQGQLLVMKRSELSRHAEGKEIDNYSTIKLQEGTRTKAGTYLFDEGGGAGSGYCPHGYPEGNCPHYGCNDEVVIVGCPDCGATNGCWCPRCFYCGNKESRCSCTRCIRCRNKIPECTCYLYPDPGTGGGSGSGGTGGTGGGGGTTGQASGKATATKITTAAEKAAKAALTKFGLSQPACNFGVQTTFNEIYTSKELDNKNANTIVDYWNANPSKWESVSMSEAQKLANEGWFVVAGWKATTGSGHVVVIISGETGKGNWNGVYTDLPNSMDTGANMKTESQLINKSFGKTKHKDVVFFKYK